jgi:hypothetical protein
MSTLGFFLVPYDLFDHLAVDPKGSKIAKSMDAITGQKSAGFGSIALCLDLCGKGRNNVVTMVDGGVKELQARTLSSIVAIKAVQCVGPSMEDIVVQPFIMQPVVKQQAPGDSNVFPLKKMKSAANAGYCIFEKKCSLMIVLLFVLF